MSIDRSNQSLEEPDAIFRKARKTRATPTLSIVIPCLNEQDVLPELHHRLNEVCKNSIDGGYEIIFVDDGSSDKTRSIITELADTDQHIVGVFLARNYGHQTALTAGLQYALGDRVLVIDADLQDPPELLPKMMQLMDQGADVVYGQRLSRNGETFFKKASASLFYRVLDKMLDTTIPRDVGDFRLLNRRSLDAFLKMPEHHRFVRGMVSWLGLRQVPINYHREERTAGQTKYPFRKMMQFAVDAITSFSIVPLRVASYLGIISSIVSIALLFYALSSWITGNTVPGWTSVIVVVLMLGGVQMLMIGIMGEYIGRTYLEVKRRPLYVVDEIVSRKRIIQDS
ncbi:MAG: glycosyltransferase family 2 protein [Pseudomonadota bacterium]